MSAPEKLKEDDLATIPIGDANDPGPDSDSAKSNGCTLPEYPAGLRLSIIVLALLLCMFLQALDMTIVATAIPKITDEFPGLDLVSWYGSAFFMCLAAFQTTWGKIYKYFPLKLAYLASILIFEIGSLLCGAAPNAITLILGRAIAGIGAAGIGSGSYILGAFSVPPAKRPLLTATLSISYGVASVIGPLVGGVFSDKVSWRWCFYINLPAGAISAMIIIFFFDTPAAAKPTPASWREKLLQMDLFGAFLLMGAVISYMLALQYGGQTKAWNSSQVIGLLVGFVAISAVFMIWEVAAGERAVVVPRIIRQRVIYVSSLFAFFFVGSYFLILYFLPLYFQSVGNASPTESGVRNLPLVLANIVTSLGAGVAISMTGYYVPFLIVSSALGTVTAGLLYTLSAGSTSGAWIGYQVLAGIAWGLGGQVPVMAVQASVAASDISSATAIVLLFQTIGGSFFLSASQSAFVNRLLSSLPPIEGVEPARVVETGATQIRSTFAPNVVPGIVSAYMVGIKTAFLIAIAGTSVAFVFSWGSKWVRLNRKKQNDTEEAMNNEKDQA
ncbi:related to major facilitator (MFS1) transporter [Fusarium fujikuroi]|nr:related to major facilitator (MFS1) transporter [Fusarium fujikuroi]